MSEVVGGQIQAPETYTARLHLVTFSHHGKNINYRSLVAPNLEVPHLDALDGVEIIDKVKGATYSSLTQVPGLTAVDFPQILSTHHTTPDWLSHEKRELYDRALELGETHLAQGILKGWVETNMRSTHLKVAQPSHGDINLVGVNKIHQNPELMTRYLGRHLAAWTSGPARTKRTPAFSAAIAIAATRGVLPLPPVSVRLSLLRDTTRPE